MHGVVDVYGARKPSWEVLRRESAPVEIAAGNGVAAQPLTMCRDAPQIRAVVRAAAAIESALSPMAQGDIPVERIGGCAVASETVAAFDAIRNPTDHGGHPAPGRKSPSGPRSSAHERLVRLRSRRPVAAIAGLLFGFDIAVINGAMIFLREQLHLTEGQTELAASSLLFGCIFGASLAGWLSDRFGRRRVLMNCALLFTVSAIGAAIPRTLAEFIAARFAGGIAIGAASVLAPLYIAEVAPARAARTSGVAEPDGHRDRDLARLSGELVPLLPGAHELALDVRGGGGSRHRILRRRCSSCPRVRDGWSRNGASRKRGTCWSR